MAELSPMTRSSRAVGSTWRGGSQAMGSSSGSQGRRGSLPAAPQAPHRKGAGGSGRGGQKGPRFAAGRASSKSWSVFIGYSALALSLFTHINKLANITITKLELNFFPGKPWISVLGLALIGQSYSFYRKGLRLFLKNELTKWKWNILK